MKITKSQLKQIIKEELETIKEAGVDLSRVWQYNRDNFFANTKGASIAMHLAKEFGEEHYDAINDALDKMYDELARDLYDQGPLAEDPRLNQQSFDTDGDGDVDKLDPEAVRRALQADT